MCLKEIQHYDYQVDTSEKNPTDHSKCEIVSLFPVCLVARDRARPLVEVFCHPSWKRPTAQRKRKATAGGAVVQVCFSFLLVNVISFEDI